MSTSEQIREVYEAEIAEKSKIIEKKFGLLAFYENGKGMRKFEILDVDPCWTIPSGEVKCR